MPNSTTDQFVDFDLHGFVGIRLVDATRSDAEAVRRQLGPIDAPLTREPDIVCRFVDRLDLPRLRYIGLDDAAFTDDAYLILRGKHRTPARVQIPISDIGSKSEIVCERGVPAVPLLIAIINLTALAKGFAPLHASAFTFDGLGVMVVGWAKGGKTEALLGFMANGARYIGDEWIYLAPDGSQVFGIPEPMKIWASHLAAMPDYRRAASRADRIRLGSLDVSAGLASRAARATKRTAVGKLLRRGLPLLEQQAFVHLSPARLFGADRCDLRGPLDVVVLAMTREEQGVAVEPTDVEEIAARMAFSVEYERLDLVAHYLRFRFAFPEARNTFLDESLARQQASLIDALRGKRGLVLYHPYPAPIPAMYEALRSCLR